MNIEQHRFAATVLVAAVAAVASVAAQAQSSTTAGVGGTGLSRSAASGSDGYSLVPYTSGGYFGLNVGRPKYDTGCGTPGFECDDGDTSVRVYTGGMLNPFFGVEFAYLHMGDADRSGGTTRAQGVNLSLVGRVPVGDLFGVFAKVGTTYGRTRVSASPLSLVETGSDNGFGLSYGAGASFDFTRNWAVLLEWERHDFRFPGGRDPVDAGSVGLKYKF